MPDEPAHLPVLRDAVLDLLAPARARVLLDATIGRAGHARALLSAAPKDAVLIGIDLDETNARAARQALGDFAGRVRVFHAGFDAAPQVLAEAACGPADAVLADLGVASNQLDDPARGLSFAADGPLDMRLDRTQPRTAAELVNAWDERALADVIYAYGEERYSRRIARAIVAARRQRPIERTGELARIVATAVPAPARRRRRGVHPATRTFQALRIAVNDELGRLDRFLAAVEQVVAPGGRVAIIAFHSLEDGRVKRAFADREQAGAGRRLTRKPITPDADEVARNPRSRSAKLRGWERAA